jgi:hypothetical protein
MIFVNIICKLSIIIANYHGRFFLMHHHHPVFSQVSESDSYYASKLEDLSWWSAFAGSSLNLEAQGFLATARGTGYGMCE